MQIFVVNIILITIIFKGEICIFQKVKFIRYYYIAAQVVHIRGPHNLKFQQFIYKSKNVYFQKNSTDSKPIPYTSPHAVSLWL